MRILALCGSLRLASRNLRALQTARALAPVGVDVRIWEGLGRLPLFSPDLDRDDVALPLEVTCLHAEVESADGLLIACPEYAHGIPGAFKNGLDWLVGSVVFPEKPIALLNIAPHATFAQAALREVLATMSADIVEEACCTVAFPPLERPDLEKAFEAVIQSAVSVFSRALETRKADLPERERDG